MGNIRIEQTSLYDALHQLVSKEAEGELFGTSAKLAREAFVRSLVADIMPTIWFELPLLGKPRFDLHVAYGNVALHEAAPFDPSVADGHGDLLNWYASEPREGGGLALAYDVGAGRIANPAVHVNINKTSRFDTGGFFTHVGRPEATELYDGFVRRMTREWRVWYFGVHPGRLGAPVRIDCFVSGEASDAYKTDPELLEAHLSQAGVDVTPSMVRIAQAVAAASNGLELQFDVLPDGSTGPTTSISAGFGLAAVNTARRLWEADGGITRIMGLAEELGMCDKRWQRAVQTLLATKVRMDGQPLAFYCTPVFIKLRLREGEPLDAKLYLQAGAMPM